MPTESSASLVLPTRPSRRDAARPASQRATASGVAIVVAAAVVSSSLVLPLGILGVLASVSVLGLVGIIVGATPLRVAMAAHAVRRARYVRRDAREQQLVAGSVGYQSLIELTHLVDDIEARDPDLVQRSDLESLLDRFAALMLAHERALCAAQLTDRVQLHRIRDAILLDPGSSPRRLELCERRLRCLAECEAKAEQFADELAVIADTIRLIAQQVACPDDLPTDDIIDRQLTAIDENAAAHRQLALELHGR